MCKEPPMHVNAHLQINTVCPVTTCMHTQTFTASFTPSALQLFTHTPPSKLPKHFPLMDYCGKTNLLRNHKQTVVCVYNNLNK